MTKYCFVDPFGNPRAVIHPSREDTYTHGEVYFGNTAYKLENPNIDDEYVIRCFYWKDGVQSVRPPKPSDSYYWDMDSCTWLIDLSLAKKEKTLIAKESRNTKEFSPFTYNGMVFDGDLDAQRRISVLVSAAKTALAMGNSFTKEFTLADNTVVQLTAEDFIGIEMAKVWQVDAAFQEYRTKKAQIEAATTLEELEAIPV